MPEDVRVLVPVAILSGQVIPEPLIRFLSRGTIVVLAYHEIPEQTAPEQAREQFEPKAHEELADLVETIESLGGTAETRLVFTHESEQTIERVATEADCDVVLLSNPAQSVERLIVPVKEHISVDRIATVVSALSQDPSIDITLFHVATDESGVADGEDLLGDVSDELVVRGVQRDNLSRMVTVSSTPLQAIVDAADHHDVIVMGEEEPTLRGRLFGETSERVAERTLSPVLVVRNPTEPDEEQ
ncbi:universal stress protein [Haloferax elongans ATCC BAA-1513]|uniref:Universal stress protein n=1 Tax=Haloferax elongans ATCC BAA-1513 TaxID=1230453 RepID=M0HLN3_HALEO|nr:universal stress protein [Haloferax elongans]ELZ84622.1 universal stress protein [Haloferax elongans ATCC BAA-1513]